MAERSSVPRRSVRAAFVVFFLLGALGGIIQELRGLQRNVEALAVSLSKEAAAQLRGRDNPAGLEEILSRHLKKAGLERIRLFGPAGRQLAEYPPVDHTGRIQGVLGTARAGIRDAASGREIAQMVVWKNIGAAVGWSALLAFALGGLAALVSWDLALVRAGRAARGRAARRAG